MFKYTAFALYCAIFPIQKTMHSGKKIASRKYFFQKPSPFLLLHTLLYPEEKQKLKMKYKKYFLQKSDFSYFVISFDALILFCQICFLYHAKLRINWSFVKTHFHLTRWTSAHIYHFQYQPGSNILKNRRYFPTVPPSFPLSSFFFSRILKCAENCICSLLLNNYSS